MDEIKLILEDVVKGLSHKKILEQQKIEEIFTRVLKHANCLKHLQTGMLKEGLLIVLADSPAWLFQCNLKKDFLLKEIQAVLPEVKKIFFKIGKVR